MQGTVTLGTNLEIAVLRPGPRRAGPRGQTLWDIADRRSRHARVGPVRSGDGARGSRKHVVAYLKDFLFDDAQARAPVRSLSGGEKARLLLARIMAKPSNLLVLDEPTNDLDVETLDLLQDVLGDYDGTVLLVSHDRDFIDRVARHDRRDGGRRPRDRLCRRLERLSVAARRDRAPSPRPPPRKRAPPADESRNPRKPASALPRSTGWRRFPA